MKFIVAVLFFACLSNSYGFEVYREVNSVDSNESSIANKTMESAPQPSHLVGRVANKVATDLAKGLKEMDMSKAECYKIKNDALKGYCERGESACGDFGLRSNKNKFGIPDWVEDFCRNNYSLKDKDLDDYYRSGYTNQFKNSETNKSANKYRGDLSSRKRWVIYYVNGFLLKSY